MDFNFEDEDIMQTVNITKEEAMKLVQDYDSDRFFSVKFVKRTDGSIRQMNCRKGVRKFTNGGTLAYNPKDKNLVCVWDTTIEDPARAYRMINLDQLLEVVMNKTKYIVV